MELCPRNREVERWTPLQTAECVLTDSPQALSHTSSHNEVCGEGWSSMGPGSLHLLGNGGVEPSTKS